MEDLYMEMEDNQTMTEYYMSLPSNQKTLVKNIINLDGKIR